MKWTIEYEKKNGELIERTISASCWRTAMIKGIVEGKKAGLKFRSVMEFIDEEEIVESSSPVEDDYDFISALLYAGEGDELEKYRRFATE
jgi:hypothetical protein